MEICIEGFVEDSTSWETKLNEAESIELALQWIKVISDTQIELALEAQDEDFALDLLITACQEVKIELPDELHFFSC